MLSKSFEMSPHSIVWRSHTQTLLWPASGAGWPLKGLGVYKYSTPKALSSWKYGSRVPNLASRVATSQLKEPRVMPDLARVTRIFNCANNFWVGYLHCYIEDGRQFHEISYSQTKTFVHFHSKYLTKIIKKIHSSNHFKRLAQKKTWKLCCSNFQNRAVAKKRAVAVLKTVP